VNGVNGANRAPAEMCESNVDGHEPEQSKDETTRHCLSIEPINMGCMAMSALSEHNISVISLCAFSGL
jgi:hypothetical protein